MKKTAALLLAVTMVFTALPALSANEASASTDYTISVNGKELDLSELPLAPYMDGDTLMVPLRLIGEALGYTVGYDTETGDITIDDDYIQSATLHNGDATVEFYGRLKIINLSREVENSRLTVIHNGYTYVPLKFFCEFFNDTSVDGGAVSISTSFCELDG